MRTRDKQLNIRMTEKEYQQIKNKADRVKLNVSTYIIKSACDKRITVIEEFRNFHTQLTKIGNNLNQLSLTSSEDKEMKTRLKSFRKYFDANKPLKKFDADVFESIVEKIILGGIDDKGQKDPHQLTFVFKTGPKSTISMGKDDDSDSGKGLSLLKKGKELYSQLSTDTG